MRINSDKAKEIIEKIKYITIATVDANGQPWNSPVYSAYDEDYNFYWASWVENQHSQNIARNNKIFLVIYDSTVPEGTGEGVYVLAKAHQLNKIEEIERGLKYLDGRVNKKPHNPDAFMSTYPRRVYKAVPKKFWMNDDGDVGGNFVDIRKEVS